MLEHFPKLLNKLGARGLLLKNLYKDKKIDTGQVCLWKPKDAIFTLKKVLFRPFFKCMCLAVLKISL